MTLHLQGVEVIFLGAGDKVAAGEGLKQLFAVGALESQASGSAGDVGDGAIKRRDNGGKMS